MISSNYKYLFVIFILIFAYQVKRTSAQGSCVTLRKVPGACVPALTCGTIVKVLNMAPRPVPPSIIDFVRRSHCGTFNNVPHVCCEISRITSTISASGSAQPETPTQPTRPSIITARNHSLPTIHKSEDIVEENVQSGMALLEATACGSTVNDKVANGENASLSEFPWMALLVYSDGMSTTLDCGGSLITTKHVLTAAHCICVQNKRLVKVRLGEHNIEQDVDCEPAGNGERCATPIQEIDIEEAIYHKDYNRYRFSNDIGIIRLAKPAVLQRNVRPICLPITESSRSAYLNRLIIAGWGRMANGRKANVLQKAIVPVINNNYCQELHRFISISENQMCAGGENEIDTCRGDSGGPLFVSAPYNKGPRYIQYGIVSAGRACGSNYPGIYVRVEKYISWIVSHLGY